MMNRKESQSSLVRLTAAEKCIAEKYGIESICLICFGNRKSQLNFIYLFSWFRNHFVFTFKVFMKEEETLFGRCAKSVESNLKIMRHY